MSDNINLAELYPHKSNWFDQTNNDFQNLITSCNETKLYEVINELVNIQCNILLLIGSSTQNHTLNQNIQLFKASNKVAKLKIQAVKQLIRFGITSYKSIELNSEHSNWYGQ